MPLRDVVQRYRQNHHGGALELAFGPSACKLFWCRCGMRWSSSSKKQDTQPETHRRREKCQPAQICGLLHSRDQQAPYRCRHHHPGGKAGEGALDAVTQRVFQKRTHSPPQDLCPERGSISPRMRLVSCSTSLWLNATNCTNSILRSGKRSRALRYRGCRSFPAPKKFTSANLPVSTHNARWECYFYFA